MDARGVGLIPDVFILRRAASKEREGGLEEMARIGFNPTIAGF